MDASLDTDVVAVGIVGAPFIALLINPLKKRLLKEREDLMLYVAIVVSLSWTLAYYWTQNALAKETIMATILLGVTTGAAAAGSYDVVQTVTDRSKTANDAVDGIATGVSKIASKLPGVGDEEEQEE